MEANRKRNIKFGEQYTYLFPKAEGTTATILKDANVTHTVAFIPKVVAETLDQTKRLSSLLKAATTYDTCKNIWHFVYGHIAYKKDQEGYEQIRSPARAWRDRKSGVDCDCYSVFISSLLTNLRIPHVLRITKYHRDYFQHIYPVVQAGGKSITIDCVTDQFDYEVPYSEKKDYPMDLQYLNGFDDEGGMGELGKAIARKMNAKKGAAKATAKSNAAPKKKGLFSKVKSKAAKPASSGGAPKPKKVKGIKKILNKVNKINPATVLLRNGILASMKLNVKNVAKRLRWSYLSPEEAAKKGIDAAKFQRLIATRQKLESIFFGAGGKVANLKKAILGGKGNKDKAVNGLEGFSFSGVDYISTYTPLPQLLGRDVYYSENVEGFEGLGQLGEPVTLASVAAAAGVIAGIVASLKQIGDIFQKKGKGSEDFDEKTNEAAENNAPVPDTTPLPPSGATPPLVVAPIDKIATEEAFIKPTESSGSSELLVRQSQPDSGVTPIEEPYATQASESTSEVESNSMAIVPEKTSVTQTGVIAPNAPPPPPEKENFWDKNKSWMKPVAIGVGGISLLAIGFAVLKPKPSNRASRGAGLSGIPTKKKPKHPRKTKTPKKAHQKKTAVALL